MCFDTFVFPPEVCIRAYVCVEQFMYHTSDKKTVDCDVYNNRQSI